MIKEKLSKLKNLIHSDFINRKGKKLSKKYLIIESDDWGAIRTPSKNALEAFEKKGFENATSIYQNDALESNEDMEALLNLLISTKDHHGKPLSFTANAIMANPDFEKIKSSNFNQYYYEDFRKTLLKYPFHDKVFEKWIKGKNEGVFIPQFHGREHLQYKRWLQVLQSGNRDALFSFEHQATYSGKADYSFMEAYDWDSPEDLKDQISIIEQGLAMFEDAFGFQSETFIAPCYNWDSALESTLYKNGVKILQGIRSQLAPTGKFDVYKRLPHYFGEQNMVGLKYNIRNCFLEPSMNPSKDWVDSCMLQIQSAFRWSKPAVICSHRINYIGFINENNRTRGLKDLETLINRVLKKWPDVNFISTNQLIDLI